MYVIGERGGLQWRNRQATLAHKPGLLFGCHYTRNSPVDFLECRDTKLQLLRVAGSVKLPDLDVGWINTGTLHVTSPQLPVSQATRAATIWLCVQGMLHLQPTEGSQRHVLSPAQCSSWLKQRHITTRSCTLTSHFLTGW